MTRKGKNLVLWVTCGLFVGTYITKAIEDYLSLTLVDWGLMFAGIIAMILYYTPDRAKRVS